MVVCCLILLFLNSNARIDAFQFKDGKIVDYYGLEDLTIEILEKIKHATGHPLNTHIFSNILAAQSRSRGKKKGSNEKEHMELGRGTKKGGSEKHHLSSEKLRKKKLGKWGSSYDEDYIGKEQFMDKEEFTDEHYHAEEGSLGKEFDGGHKRARTFLNKGYEDFYRKDETKRSDSFWDNHQQYGKWHKYGSEAETRKKDENRSRSEEKETEMEAKDGYKIVENTK